MDFSALNSACLNTFGISVTYTPADVTVDPFTLTGIFDKGIDVAARGADVAATLFVRLSDLPAIPAKGDRVTADGSIYRVTNLDPPDTSNCMTLDLRYLQAA